MSAPSKTGSTPNVVNWNLIRDGRQIWLTDGKQRIEVTANRVEEIANAALKVVRDARYWEDKETAV